MPWGDRTGPFGMGPRTGRGWGYCGGSAQTGFGLGRKRRWCARFFGGFGRGWRWLADLPFFGGVKEEEILKREAELLRQELDAIQKRLSQLEKKTE
ncbi:DUF5320 domain-containing protein [Thermodesulfovibrio hydrogeniphilus]